MLVKIYQVTRSHSNMFNRVLVGEYLRRYDYFSIGYRGTRNFDWEMKGSLLN
jgi:hypothetical protein